MILWDGIAAKGGVKGKLQPASRLAATQPAPNTDEQ
jgi:hypothetical protein